jgi:ATP-dependent DNA helicase RecQ
MRTLQEELDDPDPTDCGRCSVCTAPRFATRPPADLVERAERALRSRPLALDPKKMAPDAAGAMRKIPEDARTAPGWALCQIGDGGWWPVVERGLGAGRLDDEIAGGLVALIRENAPRAAWIATVPSVRLGDLCADLAGRVAADLGIPHLDLVRRTGPRPPQREMANATRQAANVRGAFAVTGTPPPGRGLLLDDRSFSGWTLAMVGGQLRRAGAEAVVPLALAALG